MKSSHKTRLFFISSGSVGLVLAVVFISIIIGVRQKVLAHKEYEMGLALQSVATVAGGKLPIQKFREAYPNYSVAIYGPDDQVIQASGPLPLSPVWGFHPSGDNALLGLQLGGEHVVTASGWNPAEHGLDDLALILAALWLPLALLVGAATWLGAQSVFRPLERLRSQTAAISGSDLTERLAIQDRAEFGAFTAQLNAMLDRIQDAVTREEQFAADAAHELRTPLAILRMQIETTLLKERQPSEYIASSHVLLGEIDRLTAIVESLLHTTTRTKQVAPPIDLQPIVQESVARIQSSVARDGTRVVLESESVSAPVLREEMRIVIDNLLGNALRFSPAPGRIEVTLAKQAGTALLRVQDEGPGIPPDQREKVFERFYRGESSRNRGSGGAGVGLAVCRRILASRGGTIKVEDSEKGAVLVCRIPVSDNCDDHDEAP